MDGADRRDIRALREIEERMAQAEEAGNAAFFHEVMADDAVIMPPGIPAIEGAGACLEFIRNVMDANREGFDRRIAYVTSEVTIGSDLAYDRGAFSQTLAPRTGGDLIYENGKYLRVYSRAHDGSWTVARVIWSMNEEPDGREEGDV